LRRQRIVGYFYRVDHQAQAEGTVLVVGFGIAGALVSWFLEKHNIKYVVVDDAAAGSSSPVAAGLINPLAGRKLALAHDLGRLLPFARQTYQQMGQFLGQSFWNDREFWTLLRDEEERQSWLDRAKDPSVHPYLDKADLEQAVPQNALAEAGVARVRGGGQVMFGPLLQTFSAWLAQQGRYHREPFLHDGLEAVSAADPACWSYQGNCYQAVLFCEGYRVRYNPWFAQLPWRVNRGQRVLLHIPGLMPDYGKGAAVWRKQALLAPIGDGNYWLGSVNDWDIEDAMPTSPAGETLRAQLGNLTGLPGQWLENGAGIRPVLRDRRPAVGFHPEHPSLGLLNGLGTKGALLGPWFASALVEHLRPMVGLPAQAAPEAQSAGASALWASVNPARFAG